MPKFMKMMNTIMAKIEWASGIRVSAMAAMGMPINSQGLRRPKRVQVWSLFKPAQGETKTLKILSQVMMKKARLGLSPKPAMFGISRPAASRLCSYSGLPACRKRGTKLLKIGQTRLIPRKPNPTIITRPIERCGFLLTLFSILMETQLMRISSIFG